MDTFPILITSNIHAYSEDVSWGQYERLLRQAGDRPIRFTYDDGRLEIMTMSYEHEWTSAVIGRLISLLAIVLNIPFESARSTTMKRKLKKKGLVPDDCYWFQHEKQMRGPKKRLNLESDPPPDLAVEVEVTRSVIKRMKIYAALRVPEVWRFKRGTLKAYVLRSDGAYDVAERSQVFPFLAMAEIQGFVKMGATMDQATLAREFMAWIAQEVKPRLQAGRKNGKRGTSKQS